MKIWLLLLLSIVTVSMLQAQPRRVDTLVGGGNLPPAHIQLLRAPVLVHPEQARRIEPTEKICFDKKLYVKSTGGRDADMYIYINTKDGIVANMIGRDGELGDGEFRINETRFRLMVLGKKGNVYTYFNSKKNGDLKHWVSTGNSETHLFQGSIPSGMDVINKKTIRNQYCENEFKTWSYKAEVIDAPVFHLYGAQYPNKLVCKEMLGYNGVGYLYTDKGMYLILEMEKGIFSAEIKEIKDDEFCFDPTDFVPLERSVSQEAEEEIEKKKEKLDNKPITGDCISQQQALKNFKKQVLDKQKTELDKTKQGNVYQNRDVQKAYSNLQDPIDMVDESILDYQLKICRLETRMNNNRSNASNADRQQKLACYNNQISRLQQAKAQMQAQDARFSNDPGKALLEKMRIMSQNMGGCN